MAKFYVVRGRKALWNLFIIVLVLAALVYIFRVESELPEEEMTVEPSRIEQVVVVEPVTVRTIPTKFSEYKLERERMRSRQIELLQNVAYDLHTQGERREEAQIQLQQLIDRITRETEIENLLKAKGYLDALVLLDTEAVTVVVPVTLTRDEAARIGELVQRLTGLGLEKITIVDEPRAV
ncbi:MAG TPA: SpoIIIAH-like family protein [Firmicutes bacterium]|jgi:stage III sporulation protein AH|nr:SpoIIIAH-like family protein [Bacillota bacterium]HHT42475.1 SpoIIIAH-like family protein [Bacillota bacterium]